MLGGWYNQQQEGTVTGHCEGHRGGRPGGSTHALREGPAALQLEWMWAGEGGEARITLMSLGLSNSKDGIAIYLSREDYRKSILGAERARIRCFEPVKFEMSVRSRTATCPVGFEI